MAIAYGAITQPGLLSQQYPPPLLPKPGKDNVRLQKLLKRSAKKKASAQASQTAAPFRSSLSPVNEASPDLEHSDHSTPPKTPETPFSLYTVQQPARFTVRPLYQHVASPYPQRAAYGRGARFSPQTVAAPSYSYSQNVTTQFSYSASVHISGVSPTPEPVAQPPVPKITLPAFPAHEPAVPAYGTYGDTSAGLRPVTAVGTPQPKPISPGPTPYQATGTPPLTRPLTVLTPFKSKSPRPTFKATEPSRSPKPMFDVPQIRMYTASTSYYETSRTPPVYDTAGLTNIGGTVPQSKTETKQDFTLASEGTRGTTPTTQAPLLGPDPQRKTPTIDATRGATPTAEMSKAITPTSELKRATPTAEIKRATPTTEIKRATPTTEIKRATPTAEIKRATPTAEIKRATPTTEVKRATPTSETRVRTPTYEFQSRISAGRPRTPAYQRAPTPVFEVSRTNPLLFAVSTVEPERSRTPKTVEGGASASLSAATPEPKPTETIPNGDILPDAKPAAKPVQQTITKAKSESDLTRGNIATTPSGSLTPTPQPTAPAVTTYGYQRPKTPTFEASRLLSTSPGYKRPKTPTYGTSPSGVSPVAFQRPKTPTQVAQKSKSSYRGLTPAEYAAYGGIKTFTPAFGIGSLKATAEGEVEAAKEESTLSKAPTQEPPKEPAITEAPKVKETPKVVGPSRAAAPSVPVIVVSQASDSPGTQEISTVSSQVAAKQEKTVKPEPPKAAPPRVEVKTPEIKKVEPVVQEVAKPKPKTPEAKPKSDDQDSLKAVRKLLGKDKVQPAEQKAKTEVQDKKEPSKPAAKPSTLPAKTGSEDKGKEKKTEATTTPDKKESNESLPAEPLLKVLQKPKGVKSKMSGWSRLKKHMVVEQEEPQFPETGSEKVTTGQDQSEAKKVVEKASEKPAAPDENQTPDTPKATKMWDAVLFQMFSTKENIMHQIELSKSEKEKEEEKTDEPKEIPSFAHRLPVLLFSPKFDAKKLKEAASRPVTKISTVFEMGLIGRKGKEEEPKDFNRTARGFTAT
ncbi:uncharacterized protein prr33 [Halichoeres trimaculatus]|uniref:uncharacterized protein prr33 n=1 Tax=Halichoeres trimaculatus TaxID=147232 RepID=UPI003D9FA04B